MKDNITSLKMLYHSNLRNVGTFISIALSILVYARYFKDKSYLSNMLFVLVGIIFLIVATFLNYMLINELTNSLEIAKDTQIIHEINTMFVIPYIVYIINIS